MHLNLASRVLPGWLVEGGHDRVLPGGAAPDAGAASRLGQTSDLKADLAEFVPQTPKITSMHGEIMAKGRGVGLHFAASVVTRPIVQIRMALVVASPAFGYFGTDDEALDGTAAKRFAVGATKRANRQQR